MKENVKEDKNEQVKKEDDKTSQMAIGDESTKEGGTLRTAAQKRADKKEREKEKKRKEAAKAKEKKATITNQATATTTTEEAAEKPQTDIGEDKKVAETSKDAVNGMSVVKLLSVVDCLIL